MTRISELLKKAKSGVMIRSEKEELRALIDDLQFEPVQRIDAHSDGPESGVALFCGVPYAFRRIVSVVESSQEPCFELQPVDPATGLVMHALGTFRGHTAPELDASPPPSAKLEVRWTSLGSP